VRTLHVPASLRDLGASPIHRVRAACLSVMPTTQPLTQVSNSMGGDLPGEVRMRWTCSCRLPEGEVLSRARSVETLEARSSGREVKHMDLTTVVIVLLVVALLGGGGWGYSRWRG